MPVCAKTRKRYLAAKGVVGQDPGQLPPTSPLLPTSHNCPPAPHCPPHMCHCISRCPLLHHIPPAKLWSSPGWVERKWDQFHSRSPVPNCLPGRSLSGALASGTLCQVTGTNQASAGFSWCRGAGGRWGQRRLFFRCCHPNHCQWLLTQNPGKRKTGFEGAGFFLLGPHIFF